MSNNRAALADFKQSSYTDKVPVDILTKVKQNYEVTPSDLSFIGGDNLYYDIGSKNYTSSSRGTISTWGEIIRSVGIQTPIKENRKTDTEADSRTRVIDGKIELVIGFKPTFKINENTFESLSLFSEIEKTVEKLNTLVISIPITSLESFFDQWESKDEVFSIEPNIIYSISAVPNDPDWDIQWGPQKIQADQAWNIQSGDPTTVLVAVIDSGIDYTHPDLSSQYVALGYDWVNDDSDPMDDYSHGTHCAGTIAATINNGIGITGVANVQIMAEKFLADDGYGNSDDAASAIIHAVDQGADILSNSWSGDEPTQVVEDALAYATAHDVIIIAAAGNNASSSPHYPSAYPEVISVSATDINDNLASFSNYGSTIEISAPGVNIYSTIPVGMGSYASKSGTSMACPHVAGVAALILSEFPNWTAEQVRSQLVETADDIGDSGWDQYYGYGRLNAFRAMHRNVHCNYTMEVGAPYKWINTTGGTVISLDDDDSKPVSFPFSFQFYGQEYSTIHVSSNGWLSFHNTNISSSSNPVFPSTNPYHYSAIALFWDDLYPSGNVYNLTLTNPNRVVIGYHDIDHFSSGRAGNFEVVFYETGEILFQYDYIEVLGTPTVGLNYGVDSILFNTYNGLTSSTDNLSILFRPDHDIVASVITPNFVALNETVVFEAKIRNPGLIVETNVELQLWINNSLVSNQSFASLNLGMSEQFNYSWTPLEEGIYNITVFAVPVTNESYIDNNYASVLIETLRNYSMSIIPYSWYDAYSNGYELGVNGDDTSGIVNLPFSFYYYDTFFSTVYVSSNGWLSFDDTSPTNFSSPQIPSSNYPYTVAPFWDDLIAENNIYVWNTSNFVAIEFHNYFHFSGALAGTFEVVFFVNGTILLLYKSIVTDYGAKVGLNFGIVSSYYTAYMDSLTGINNFALFFTTSTYEDRISIIEPINNQIIDGGIVYTKFNVTEPSLLDYIDVWINNQYITTINYDNENFELFIPVFSNGTNAITLMSYWTDGLVINTTRTIESVNVIPTAFPEVGDYFNWCFEEWSGNINDFNFSFDNWISPFEINVSLVMHRYNESGTVELVNYWLIVNVINGYIPDSNMWWINHHFYFFSGLTSSVQIGDTMPFWVWNQFLVVNGSDIWEGYNVWILTDDQNDLVAYIIKSSGLFVYFSNQYSQITAYVTNSSLLPVRDTTIPTLTSPSDITYESGTTGHNISWMANDTNPGTYIIYKNGTEIGNGSWLSTNPINISVDGLTVGFHNYTIVVMDVSYNTIIDSVIVSTIDSISPIITIITPINSTFTSTEVLVTYSLSESAIVNYYLNGVAFGLILSGTPIDGLSDGFYNLTLKAIDGVGNEDVSTVFFTIDVSPPIVSITSPTNSTFDASSVTLSYTVSEVGISVAIFLDGINKGVIMSGETLSGLSEGTHNLTVQVVDSVGNVGSSTVFFTLDTTTAAKTGTSTSDVTPINSSSPSITTFGSDYITIIVSLGICLVIFHRRRK